MSRQIGYAIDMGRRLGKHPKRTPFYGVLMMLTAMISGLWVQNIPSLPLRVVGYVALFVLPRPAS
ncbi:hypothetical protein [Nocardia thraciensis]